MFPLLLFHLFSSGSAATCEAQKGVSFLQIAHGTRYSSANKRNPTSLAESEGFFDESEEAWEMHKDRHRHQMRMQNETMTSCPEDSFVGQRACMPGCVKRMRVLQPCPAPTFWQVHYEPSFSCEFESRIGNQGEGGKWVCNPHTLKAKADAGKGCLIYSIGSKDQFDFETAVHNEISSKCEIHTMDMKDWREYGKEPAPAYVDYHVYTIGQPPATPVPKVVRDLGHMGRIIDLFKIDCEGCEFSTYKTWFGESVYIRQILVEIHGIRGADGNGVHDFFNFLFDQGYVVFHKEPNILPGCHSSCIEYAFIKMSPSFARMPL